MSAWQAGALIASSIPAGILLSMLISWAANRWLP